ncbi:LiaI-LiaF-like domain-containing protein [Roseateles sp. P5_E7]
MKPTRARRPCPPQHAGHRILFGLAVIGVGVLALLDNLHFFDIALLRTFWPLGLVLWGLGRLAWPRQSGGAMVGLVVIGVGLVLTAQNLGYMHFHWRDWWPVIIIVVGLSILMRGFFPRQDIAGAAGFEAATLTHGDLIDLDTSFSGINQRIDSQSFKGGRISSTFGGIELDLTQAVMAGDEARLDISARFSGIDLRVPRDWLVVVEINPLFGGVEDKTVPPMTPGPRLVLRGELMFAGIDIKN